METIQWGSCFFAFSAGVFFTNAVPHFINGISGNRFPTPFAKPPNKGLSSPMVNVLWAYSNLLFGYNFLRQSDVSGNDKFSLLCFIIGIVTVSFVLSKHFSKKDKEY